jgi:asparagine synthase (glutamine-hydrolysing)
MSDLCGVIRFNAPVGREEVEAMRRALPTGGATDTWVEDGAGLSGPILRRTADCVFMATARLDNADELRGEFGRDLDERELVARAYERWGEAAPHHLLGDWAFAAWHPRARRLLLARDQFGGTAMLCYTNERVFAFAPSSKALFAIAGVDRRVNELRISQLLSFWTVDGAATAFEGVRRLQPSYLAVVENGAPRVRQYWSLESAPPVRFSSDDQYVERFVELFTNAVRVRTQPGRRIGSQLSAGLDSGVVTSLAARELDERGERLTAFTSVPLFRDEAAGEWRETLVDEWPLAHRAAEWNDNVDHVAIRAEGLTPLGAVQRFLDEHGEPEIAASNYFWNMAMLDESARRGVGTLLTGAMGNVGVSWPGHPAPVLRAAARGDLHNAWRALAAWRAGYRMSWPRAVWHTLVRPAQREARRMLARARTPPFRAGPYIHPAFARRLDLEARAREAGWIAKLATGSPEELRFGVAAPGVLPGNTFYETLAHAGVEMRDPTADLRLLQFCQRVPERLFSGITASRWLMRRGAEGLLPPEVRWNVSRAVQSADVGYRLRAEAAAVDAVVARMSASPRCNEYLNLDAVKKEWAMVCNPGEAHPSRAAFRFVPLLLVGEFLARLDG